jgi:cytochrome c oxidase cbb3-type subunit 3
MLGWAPVASVTLKRRTGNGEPERGTGNGPLPKKFIPRSLFPVLCSPFVFLLVLTAACEGPPSADSLKEWAPGDHHSADDDRAGSAAARQGAPAPKGSETAQLVELAWRQQCAACHGMMGKGDGPTGPMVQAPDLTSTKATDAELAAIIKGGKGKMPKFDLPDPVVQGLVARIRQLKGR